MLFPKKNPAEKREQLRKDLQFDKILPNKIIPNEIIPSKIMQAPSAFSPMVAMEIEKLGFPAVYISGAVLAADLGLPDIGLTTLNEVAERGKQIARVTNLPCIIDADTGFGEPMNVARTVLMFEEAGLAGLHLEDQMNPKRCGHLDNKKLCSKEEMVQKIQTAVKSKRDKNFLIIARTDARAVEGMDKTLERIRIYEDAGAEMIFPEAMQNEKEFEQVRKATSLPLLANMTEFGKSELLDKNQLENLGYQMVIYPVTTWRLAIGSVVAGLKEIKEKGHQKDLLKKMQTRKELYDTLQYEKYNDFDKDIFNFKLRTLYLWILNMDWLES